MKRINWQINSFFYYRQICVLIMSGGQGFKYCILANRKIFQRYGFKSSAKAQKTACLFISDRPHLAPLDYKQMMISGNLSGHPEKEKTAKYSPGDTLFYDIDDVISKRKPSNSLPRLVKVEVKKPFFYRSGETPKYKVMVVESLIEEFPKGKRLSALENRLFDALQITTALFLQNV